uniref:Uncharacterized protein n=1 Tax=Cacopsylla melanoneura TaxID=428564 RepID=A0A8D8T1E7_9HEMI
MICNAINRKSLNSIKFTSAWNRVKMENSCMLIFIIPTYIPDKEINFCYQFKGITKPIFDPCFIRYLLGPHILQSLHSLFMQFILRKQHNSTAVKLSTENQVQGIKFVTVT